MIDLNRDEFLKGDIPPRTLYGTPLKRPTDDSPYESTPEDMENLYRMFRAIKGAQTDGGVGC